MNSRDERERIKRTMGIGEHQNANGTWETVLGETKYSIFAHGKKYDARKVKDEFCAWTPSGSVCADSLDQLRDKVIAALAERAPAVPVPDSVAWVDIDWGASAKLLRQLLEIPRDHASPAP